jgi:asparagine synthase (glutamine-hydrolysing)
MCGIAGIWSFSGSGEPKAIEDFTHCLSHRGPDGFGFYHEEASGLALGHRRLAILDLTERARQPMSCPQGRYFIVFNGEVFNFIELRQELQQAGQQFRTDTDTEVVLAAYRQWGQTCLERFNGMWAFAIWDSKKKELFLSRDRFGIKPLYYLHLPGRLFAFASETRAFTRLRGFSRSADEANLSLALEDVNALEGFGLTIYKGIRQLRPGHLMVVSQDGRLKERRWWSTLEHLGDVPSSYSKQVERFQELLQDACRLRMRSDVPIATALSGGLDSSSIYCMLNHTVKTSRQGLQRLPQDWQRAFVATFPGTSLDEKHYAQEVLQYTGGTATFIQPQTAPDLAQKLKEQTLQSDFIYLSPPVIWDIYAAVRQGGVKVSLDGHGVDEMLFGYHTMVADAYCWARQKGEQSLAEDMLRTFRHMLSPHQRQAEALQKGCIRWRLQMLYKRRLPRPLKALYKRLQRTRGDTWVLNPQVPPCPDEPLSALGELDWKVYVTFHYTVLPTILRGFDRASMAHGVEVRMPFMDWRLVTYVFSLPLSSKVGGGFTKRILRDAMKGLMPETIRTRRLKIGINAPMREWFLGPLRQFVLDVVNSPDFLNSAIWDGRAIRRFVHTRDQSRSWSWDDCIRLWPYLNAYILMHQKGAAL